MVLGIKYNSNLSTVDNFMSLCNLTIYQNCYDTKDKLVIAKIVKGIDLIYNIDYKHYKYTIDILVN